jgi:hypothetical protein
MILVPVATIPVVVSNSSIRCRLAVVEAIVTHTILCTVLLLLFVKNKQNLKNKQQNHTHTHTCSRTSLIAFLFSARNFDTASCD